MLNIAVVGCGYWGPNLIRNFMSSSNTNLTWACDLDSARLGNVLRPYPGVKLTTEFTDIINDASVDAVAIATPVASHFPLAKACLENGKHVLVEKPLAAKVSQGEELVKLAEKNKLVLMCDHTFCYTGAVRKIKEVIDSGALGKILYYDSVRINLGLFQHDVNVIWDLAVHDLAIVDFLLDRQPVQVSAHGISHAGNKENIAYVTLTYQNSFIAHFHVNWLSPVKIRKTIIGGSEKMLEWNDLVPGEKIKIYDSGISINDQDQEKKSNLLVSYRSGDIYSPRIDNTEALSLMIKEFIDSIVEKRNPLTDGHAALRVLKILEAAQRSIKADGANVRIE
ncbi:MAG: Gfo/Idh/MocA family oxidoreductase [Proteobacteria bacterium]|nr:Gfo/Idh/MocA family oxidoreductase [Pseudomonadota bacterium]MBU1716398.1 Gfo/Idh/MocA family oxidoreductase [Pseudomonadota bacterium]